MSFPPLVGHESIVERFERALAAERLPSTFLFVGEPGVGKKTFAVWLAAALLCERSTDAALKPCGTCPSCRQVEAGSHPDLEIVVKPPEKSFIPIEVFLGDREHRGREGLCHRLSLKPSQGSHKVAIVDDADFLNVEGANCLLKTLEEPAAGSVLILVATSLTKQLPTIRSRCQIVRFHPLPADRLSQLLVQQGVCSSQAEADQLAKASGGSLASAVALRDGQTSEVEEAMLAALSAAQFDPVTLATTITKHVNAAGESPSVRRAALRDLVEAAASFYRGKMYAACGTSFTGGPPVADERRPADSGAETMAACLQCCLEALTHLDSNANLTTLVECWTDDLAGLPVGRSALSIESASR